MADEIIKPFRERKGVAQSWYFSGELALANQKAWDFITETIKKYNLRQEDGYHTETRAISLADVNINDNTHGHFSDNEIILILEKWDEVVAFSYTSRNSMNCAEVIMVDLLKDDSVSSEIRKVGAYKTITK